MEGACHIAFVIFRGKDYETFHILYPSTFEPIDYWTDYHIKASSVLNNQYSVESNVDGNSSYNHC
jgi:hypothetical protein